MEILRCNDVEKVFGKGDNEVTALNGISLSIEKGEFVAIVGASGSGKSTLLHILGSVDKPTKGTVTIDGVDIGGLNATDAEKGWIGLPVLQSDSHSNSRKKHPYADAA